MLRGRVDGLEACVGELVANQFSTTTKLSALATFVVGSNVFSGSAVNSGANMVSRRTDCGNVLAVDKLFYQRPLGAGFTATLGPRVGQEDMLALWPSAYPSDTILTVFTVNGAPAAYNKNLGAGAGIWWQQNAFSISANYEECSCIQQVFEACDAP